MSIVTKIETVYKEVVAKLDHEARAALALALAEAKAEEAKIAAAVDAALTAAKTDAEAAAKQYGPEVSAIIGKLVQAVEAALGGHL